MTILRLDTKQIPLPTESIDMIFTDPPYVKDLLCCYEWLANEAARLLKPGKFVAAMCGGMAINQIMRWFDDAGLTFYWQYQLKLSGKYTGVVWINGNRSVPIATRLKHVIVYSKGDALSRTATVSPYRAGGADKRWHHWGQDVDSHRYYIDCFSWPGDLILDPMAGGGTTAIACAALDRRWIVGDIDPEACVTMKERLNGSHMSSTPLFTEMGVACD